MTETSWISPVEANKRLLIFVCRKIMLKTINPLKIAPISSVSFHSRAMSVHSMNPKVNEVSYTTVAIVGYSMVDIDV